MTRKDMDFECRETTIETVGDRGEFFDIEDAEGWSFRLPKANGVVPRVGSSVRFYGRGIGFPVRGVDVDDREVFYRTADEEEAKRLADEADADKRNREQFERDIAKHDALYESFPPELRRRLDGFRATSPDWRWQFEPYEAFSCAEAVKIAKTLETPERIATFRAASWDEQKRLVPTISEDHSGNTFGHACRMAHWLLVNPENAVIEHAGICAMLGCAEAGCYAGRVTP